MSKPKILVQLDGDPQASVFDSVVAVDAGVDHLFRHASVTVEQVRDLVYGAMFTRGVDDLHNTAVFVGGADVACGEQILAAVAESFFGPMRVSVMMDANGANTTAAAAVLVAGRHVPLEGATALVLAGTGPVGQRTARLLARQGARVRLASRRLEKAEAACRAVAEHVAGAELTACTTNNEQETTAAMHQAQIVVAAGAPGVLLLPESIWRASDALRVAVDLNAVPPTGIDGVAPTDKAVAHGQLVCYGAIGVGGTKMKIHKAALAALFTSNDQVLDAEQIYEIGAELQ